MRSLLHAFHLQHKHWRCYMYNTCTHMYMYMCIHVLPTLYIQIIHVRVHIWRVYSHVTLIWLRLCREIPWHLDVLSWRWMALYIHTYIMVHTYYTCICICALYRHILHVHVYTQDTQWYSKLLVVRSTTLHDINLGGGGTWPCISCTPNQCHITII